MALVTRTYTGQKLLPYLEPDLAVMDAVALAPNLTLVKGTVLGLVTATGVYTTYASANSDGSQVARALLMYDCTTDGAGKVSITGDQFNNYDTAPVYRTGFFRTTELTGLDANAITNALGKLIDGTVSNGTLRVT